MVSESDPGTQAKETFRAGIKLDPTKMNETSLGISNPCNCFNVRQNARDRYAMRMLSRMSTGTYASTDLLNQNIGVRTSNH